MQNITFQGSHQVGFVRATLKPAIEKIWGFTIGNSIQAAVPNMFVKYVLCPYKKDAL